MGKDQNGGRSRERRRQRQEKEQQRQQVPMPPRPRRKRWTPGEPGNQVVALVRYVRVKVAGWLLPSDYSVSRYAYVGVWVEKDVHGLTISDATNLPSEEPPP